MSHKNRSIILAVESAIAGGSLAVLAADGTLLVSRIGRTDGSRAENILSEIDDCLRSGGLTLSSLTSIVVSAGPGSYTGIRAGIATALGLSLGLSKPLLTVDTFDALQFVFGREDRSLIFLPSGRNKVVAGYSGRNRDEDSSLKHAIINIDALQEFICEHEPGTPMLYHQILRPHFIGHENAIDVGGNMAFALGMYSLSPYCRSSEPYFLGQERY
jgi:tRNA threonylcarbamoyl adenosine modification protein YeaZ